MEESALVFHDKIAPVRGKEMRDKLNRRQLKPGEVWLHKEITTCVVTIHELKNDQVYYNFSRHGGLGILKTDEFLESFEPGRNKLLKEGVIWHRKDDYAEKATITNLDENKVSYQYINAGHTIDVGVASIENFLLVFMMEYPEYDEIPVGSVWRAMRGCSDWLKGKLIKVVSFTKNIINWMCIEECEDRDVDVTGTSRSSFKYCFERIKNNDNDALYGFRDTPGKVAKIIKTKVSLETSESFKGSIEYFFPIGENDKSYIGELTKFHTCHTLISLDPAKEFTVPTDSVNHLTVNPEEDEIKPNQIWMNKITFRGQPIRYVKIEKPVHDNVVHWINIGNGNEISWTNVNVFLKYYEKIAENDEGYEYVDRRNIDTVVTVLPYKFSGVVCYKMKNEHDFREDVRKFHEIYEPWGLAQTRRNNNMENETKVEVKEEESKFNTYLKTDASKLEDFGTGAKREDKKGKGRYDLIPGEVVVAVKDYAWNTYFKKGTSSCSKDDVDNSAYFDDWMDEEKYLEFITNVIVYFYVPDELKKPCVDDDCHDAYVTNWTGFCKGLRIMRKALAGHYEAGAEVHGVDNWKKGLPVYGSSRGGCFLDSMRRHSDQALEGLTDEPHAIAAIWNAVCAVWTLRYKSKSAIYQNASAIKNEIDDKPRSTHFDMIDSALDALKYMPGNKIEK